MGTKGRWTDGAVLRESERWVHVPAAGTLVEDGERFLVHPTGRRGTSRVWRSWPAQGRAEGLLQETIEEVRASGGVRLVWHTGDAISPPFMDDLLSRRGFEKTEDLEALAFDLGDEPRPNLPRFYVPDDIHVALVRDRAEIRAAHAVASGVFPDSPTPTEPELRAYLRGLEGQTPGPEDDDAREFRFLAFLGNQTQGGEKAIATAGAQVVGAAVGCWNACEAQETGRLPRPGRREVPLCPRPRRHARLDEGEHVHLRAPSPKRRVPARGLRTPPRVTDPTRLRPGQPRGITAG